MKTARTDLAALIIVAIAIAAITLLTLQHQPVPEIMSTVALVALGIGGGIAVPNRASADPVAAVAAAVESAPLVPAPAPAPAVERLPAPVATHAP